MSWYSIMFERIYAVFHKGASIHPNEEKLDGAVLTCILLYVPIVSNFYSIMHFLRMSTGWLIPQNKFVFTVVSLIVIIFHFLLFIQKKRYQKISEYVAAFSKRKKLIATIFSWLYFVGSFVFFILFLTLTKPGS